MNNNPNQSPSVLALLRRLVPPRQVTQQEALRLAELQAARFRMLTNTTDVRLPESVLAELPRISIQRRDLPTSGLSYWDGDNWIIALNRREPSARQRFTLMHEYKHILDHGATDRLYSDSRTRSAAEHAEQAADYFAGCVLMPKSLLKRAWGEGVQTLSALAQRFEVSTRAVEVRLAQVGITEPTRRCEPPRTYRGGTRGITYRVKHSTFKAEGAAA